MWSLGMRAAGAASGVNSNPKAPGAESFKKWGPAVTGHVVKRQRPGGEIQENPMKTMYFHCV